MYDIIVIGAGSGGLNVAVFMNTVGLNVLLIDKSDENIGGDCLNTGCVPSKALIHVARTIKSSQNAEMFGIGHDGKVDFKKVMEYVNRAQDTIRVHENAEYFRDMGLTVALGEANFVSKNEIEVAGVKYKGKKIVVATGSRPRELNISGIDDVKKAGKMYTNENIFSMTKLPRHLLVIGAGPIGIELGQAFRHLGSKVTILTNGDKILPREDNDVTEVLFERLKKDGINFLFNKDTESFSSKNELVVKDNITGENSTHKFDAVLVSIGRILNIESLELQKAGIEIENGKIMVDEYLQTTNKDVFLCGDVVGQHQFTHAAEIHAGVIIKNFFTPFFKKKLSTDTISWVTYTTPELATYGLNEAELNDRGISYKLFKMSFKDDDRAITDDSRYGYTKMFMDTKSNKILGGTMIAPNAGELIQELILAVSSGLSVKDIFNKTYPYPTASRINKKLVSEYFKTKLSLPVKRTMKYLYKIGL